jgi:hypothetical protein
MQNINAKLLARLAAKKAGKYRSPSAANYSSKWGGTPFAVGGNVGYRNSFARWHESPETPFRFVGLASDCVKLGHTGWYTRGDDCGSELSRGAVYMLPHGRYLAAIADPYQSAKDGTGPAMIETDREGNPEIYRDKESAAQAADRLAEIHAESAREDDRVFCRVQSLESERDEAENTLDELRSDARGLLEEIRESKLSPGLCQRLKAQLASMRREMHEAYATSKSAKQTLATLPRF